MGGKAAWKPRRLAAYSPKAKAVGRKLKEIRECIGMTVAEAAARVGVEDRSLMRYEAGNVLPGREMQRRFILTYFGNWTWRDAPSAPIIQGNNRPEEVRATIRLSKEGQERLDVLCKRFDISAGAVVDLALEQLCDNTPVLTTLREAGRRYEDLRWRSILEGNADLTTILESDPIMARLAHEGLRITNARDKMLDPKFLTAWLDNERVGSYMEVANIQWRRKEGEVT